MKHMAQKRKSDRKQESAKKQKLETEKSSDHSGSPSRDITKLSYESFLKRLLRVQPRKYDLE